FYAVGWRIMFDIHTHCHQPQHRDGGWESVSRRAYGDRAWAYTPRDFSDAMIAGGVDVAAVFGVTARAADVFTPNDFVEDFCAQLDVASVPFVALDLLDPEWEAQLEDGIARGFRGVKLYPALALFDPADAAFDRFYR